MVNISDVDEINCYARGILRGGRVCRLELKRFTESQSRAWVEEENDEETTPTEWKRAWALRKLWRILRIRVEQDKSRMTRASPRGNALYIAEYPVELQTCISSWRVYGHALYHSYKATKLHCNNNSSSERLSSVRHEHCLGYSGQPLQLFAQVLTSQTNKRIKPDLVENVFKSCDESFMEIITQERAYRLRSAVELFHSFCLVTLDSDVVSGGLHSQNRYVHGAIVVSNDENGNSSGSGYEEDDDTFNHTSADLPDTKVPTLKENSTIQLLVPEYQLRTQRQQGKDRTSYKAFEMKVVDLVNALPSRKVANDTCLERKELAAWFAYQFPIEMLLELGDSSSPECYQCRANALAAFDLSLGFSSDTECAMFPTLGMSKLRTKVKDLNDSHKTLLRKLLMAHVLSNSAELPVVTAFKSCLSLAPRRGNREEGAIKTLVDMMRINCSISGRQRNSVSPLISFQILHNLCFNSTWVREVDESIWEKAFEHMVTASKKCDKSFPGLRVLGLIEPQVSKKMEARFERNKSHLSDGSYTEREEVDLDSSDTSDTNENDSVSPSLQNDAEQKVSQPTLLHEVVRSTCSQDTTVVRSTGSQDTTVVRSTCSQDTVWMDCENVSDNQGGEDAETSSQMLSTDHSYQDLSTVNDSPEQLATSAGRRDTIVSTDPCDSPCTSGNINTSIMNKLQKKPKTSKLHKDAIATCSDPCVKEIPDKRTTISTIGGDSTPSLSSPQNFVKETKKVTPTPNSSSRQQELRTPTNRQLRETSTKSQMQNLTTSTSANTDTTKRKETNTSAKTLTTNTQPSDQHQQCTPNSSASTPLKQISDYFSRSNKRTQNSTQTVTSTGRNLSTSEPMKAKRPYPSTSSDARNTLLPPYRPGPRSKRRQLLREHAVESLAANNVVTVDDDDDVVFVSSTKKKQPPRWSCCTCTFRNPVASEKCQICYTPRKVAPVVDLTL